jgi:alpha-tubulin suppressor-like RCC1 family protein
VAAGELQSLALRTDGTLWVAGDNESGQLGFGTFSDYESTLAVVPGGMTWRSAAAGRFMTVAVRSDNTLWAWGHLGVGGIAQVGSGNGTTNGWGMPNP